MLRSVPAEASVQSRYSCSLFVDFGLLFFFSVKEAFEDYSGAFHIADGSFNAKGLSESCNEDSNCATINVHAKFF